jgi:phosphoribosylamine--glycine ligase
MEKVGILVVSYGARETAMIDAFSKSTEYNAQLYVADKQQNPFNIRKAAKHIVVPDLNINEICKFAETNKDKLDFCIVGPEKPIIEGIRDLIEKRTRIPVICPTKQYAIEASKIQQRMLFEQIVPEANPRFKIFNPKDYKTTDQARKEVYKWLDELNNNAVVKPDQPAAGKGVGVWGDHFTTRQELYEHFMANLQQGPVIMEEKIEGEESSFQAFCDGKHLVPLPETRDYKRAFDNDIGPNTGGMGSYKDKGDILPFMTKEDRDKELEIVNRIFQKWKIDDKTALRGIPFYVAFMHTRKAAKILENNSRPGDPEIINILPILKDDFVNICFRILEGNLTRIGIEKKATVVTYKVPPNYGGYMGTFPEKVEKQEIGTTIDLNEAYALVKKYSDRIHAYPAALEQRNDEIYALKSRAVAVVGIGANIEEARQNSLEGTKAIKGGALWYRTDIASQQHIEKSIKHMQQLRRKL